MGIQAHREAVCLFQPSGTICRVHSAPFGAQFCDELLSPAIRYDHIRRVLVKYGEFLPCGFQCLPQDEALDIGTVLIGIFFIGPHQVKECRSQLVNRIVLRFLRHVAIQSSIVIADRVRGKQVACKALRFRAERLQQFKRCGLAPLDIPQMPQRFIGAVHGIHRARRTRCAAAIAPSGRLHDAVHTSRQAQNGIEGDVYTRLDHLRGNAKDPFALRKRFLQGHQHHPTVLRTLPVSYTHLTLPTNRLV